MSRSRGWVAALLSVLMPGLGHLYAGRALRAIAAFILLQVLGFGLVYLTLVASTAPLRVVLIVLLLAGFLAVVLDAARVARRDTSEPRRRVQRWYVLLPVCLGVGFIVQPWIFGLTKRHIVEAHRFPGGSMVPTILPGDYLLSSPRAPDPVTRGELVVYQASGQRNIHRVVGLPGDTISMRDFQFIVNGTPAHEPYAHAEDGSGSLTDPQFQWQRGHLRDRTDAAGYQATYGTWGPLVVPEGAYFVLGDDRANSFDSRYRGFIATDALVGRPVWIYFSRDPDTGIIRWSRIGLGVGA